LDGLLIATSFEFGTVDEEFVQMLPCVFRDFFRGADMINELVPGFLKRIVFGREEEKGMPYCPS
jgi:hypothetical protein